MLLADEAGSRAEPTLKDMLSDPIVMAMMEADGVDPRELEAMLTHVGSSRGVKTPA
jgi:hypothetical protein